MSNNGQETNPSSQSATVGWWGIALAIVLLVSICAVVIRPMSALMGLLFIPNPPIPPQAEQLAERSPGYGTNTWIFETPVEACDVVRFYHQQGTCDVMTGHCGMSGEKADALAATCVGATRFSEFVMNWEADIFDYPRQTRIELHRDTIWTDGADSR